MPGIQTACGCCDVVRVAAAMLRCVVSRGPSLLRLEAEPTGRGVLLRLSYPPQAVTAGAAGSAAIMDLTLVDSLAERWGHDGGEECRVLWAVLPGPDCDLAHDCPACGTPSQYSGATHR
jgi:hypothetical protein